MGLRHLVAATTLGLVAATVHAAPAQARPPEDASRDGHHGAVSVDTTVPPGGNSMLTSPTIRTDATSLKVKVKPKNPVENEDFDQFITAINVMPKSKRLLACVMMYQLIASPHDSYGDVRSLTASNLAFGGAVLLVCLQMAGLLQAEGRAAPRRAGTACGSQTPSLPMTVTKDSTGYTVNAEGTTTKFTKPKVKVKCRAKGHTLTYTIKSAKKGKPLRKTVGKKLMIGLQSPADATGSVTAHVTFIS